MTSLDIKKDALPIAALKALRPKQWTKNVLLFAALVFSTEFLNTDSVIKALWAFAAFSLVSSVGYIINDILDRDADAQHPRKRKRPIASGALPVGMAWGLAATIAVAGFGLSFLLNPWFALVAGMYFINTMTYTFWGKHKVIVDIMMIAAGFLLRAVAGGVAIDVPISPWLLMCAGFFALFLGFNKRRGELVQLEEKAAEHRKNLALYSTQLLDEYQSITTSAAIMSYALYTVLADYPNNPWLLLTVPLPLYGIFRYVYVVQREGEGDPSTLLLRDRGIMLVCFLYAITTMTILVL